MRIAQALLALATEVHEAFPDDVAAAITSDADMFRAAGRQVARVADTPEDVADLVARIAGDVDDGLADWLVDVADSPAGWLYRQITEH